jgi:hypothetical protein
MQRMGTGEPQYRVDPREHMGYITRGADSQENMQLNSVILDSASEIGISSAPKPDNTIKPNQTLSLTSNQTPRILHRRFSKSRTFCTALSRRNCVT